MMPPMSAVSTMARGITLPAFGVSSESELRPSKPRKEKQRMVAPVNSGSMLADSTWKGRLLSRVPVPSPCSSPQAMRPRKVRMMATWINTMKPLRLATSLMPRRFRKVITVTRPKMKIQGSTFGNMAVR
ncbi:hypothetical protein D3C79_847770 [compost metagenome]